MSMTLIRPARAAEAALLPALEFAAQQRFQAYMPAIASGGVTADDIFATRIEVGRCLVAADDADAPIAFLIWDILDGNAYIRELAVLPEHAGRRIGARLIDAMAGMARRRGMPMLTLTTFRDIPWNAPYYVRLGFTEMPEAEYGPDLTAMIAMQRRHGLDISKRLAMKRAL